LENKNNLYIENKLSKCNFAISLLIEKKEKIISKLNFIELGWEETRIKIQNERYSGINPNNQINEIESISMSISNELKSLVDYKNTVLNSMTKRSSIIFYTCLIPNEVSSESNSLKAINNALWLKDKLDNNNYDNVNVNDSFDRIKNKDIISKARKEYVEDVEDYHNRSDIINILDYEDDNNEQLNIISNRLSRKKEAKNKHSDNLSEGLQQEINMLKELKKKKNLKIKNDQSDRTNIKSKPETKNNSVNLNKLSDLEKSIRYNERKIDEINRNMENLILMNRDKQQLNNNNNNNNISDILEIESMKKENITLKSDNMIFREDIIHLTEINRKLEEELNHLRKKK
jgi:hypothetical protein